MESLVFQKAAGSRPALAGRQCGSLAPLPRTIRAAVHTGGQPLGVPLIILGIILLIIGFIAKIAIVWTIGIIVLIAGAILALLGMMGHAVGGRRHYF
jgi:hypothetical protein